MLDRTHPRDWRSITAADIDAMSPDERRAWRDAYLDAISGGAWSGTRREPFTSADLQREHQADHDTHVANGEVRIGRRG